MYPKTFFFSWLLIVGTCTVRRWWLWGRSRLHFQHRQVREQNQEKLLIIWRKIVRQKYETLGSILMYPECRLYLNFTCWEISIVAFKTFACYCFEIFFVFISVLKRFSSKIKTWLVRLCQDRNLLWCKRPSSCSRRPSSSTCRWEHPRAAPSTRGQWERWHSGQRWESPWGRSGTGCSARRRSARRPEILGHLV